MPLLLLTRFLLLGLGLLRQPGPASRAAQAAPSDLVHWQSRRLLRWHDFQAPACPVRVRAGERQLGACSATTIDLIPCTDAQGRGTFQVDAYLTKSSSWVRDSTSAANRLTLAHEQVHFDINELYARKIRALVASYYQARSYPFGPDLRAQSELLLLEKTSCNNRFDAEAAANPLGGSVGKWQALVSQQIQALAAYPATACPCAL